MKNTYVQGDGDDDAANSTTAVVINGSNIVVDSLENGHREAVPIVVDAKLENLGSFNRVMTGTWTQGGVKGDFKLTRN